MSRPRRTPVPPATAARVQFLSDRTCCVCRTPGKPVQLHHLDEDPANHDPHNLALLCLDCHNETQIRGGFGRKLDAEQVLLYRDDWYEAVASRRVSPAANGKDAGSASDDARLELATYSAEAYRENEEWSLLASHYDSLGQDDLRDKYIDRALAEDPSDFMIVHLRGMQGRPDLIPREVIDREAARYEKNRDWSQRARFWLDLGEPAKAVADYARTVLAGLEEHDRVFSAAFYLRELSESGLYRDLYFKAFEEAKERDDLWWQARALQDLQSREQYAAWLAENAEAIERDGNFILLAHLADVRGDKDRAMELRKRMIRGTRTAIVVNDSEGGEELTDDLTPADGGAEDSA